MSGTDLPLVPNTPETVLSSAALPARTPPHPQALALHAIQTEGRIDKISRDLLNEIVDSIPSKVTRASFDESRQSTDKLFDVLRVATPEQRQGFVAEMITLALSGEVGRKYVEGKLSAILRYSPPAERAATVKGLLVDQENKEQIGLAERILRISSDLKTLAEVVENVGAETFAQQINPLREYVAHLVIGIDIRQSKQPEKLGANAKIGTIVRRLAELTETLKERIEICDSQPELAQTRVAKMYRDAAKYNLNWIRRELKDPESAGVVGFREFANMMIMKSALEANYCVSLTVARTKQIEEQRRWTTTDIEDIAHVFGKIGEGRILFTPLLHEIRRVASIKDEDAKEEDDDDLVTFAVRHSDGCIEVSDEAIDDKGLKKQYDGLSSLRPALCHEIGHGLQIGKHCALSINSAKERINGPGDALYDFDRWLEISGWIVYDRKRWKSAHDDQAVLIDQKSTLPLETPVQHEGKWLVLRMDKDEKMLYAHRFDAEFSLRDYSRTTPWEDWAEAFTEYMLLPESGGR